MLISCFSSRWVSNSRRNAEKRVPKVALGRVQLKRRPRFTNLPRNAKNTDRNDRRSKKEIGIS